MVGLRSLRGLSLAFLAAFLFVTVGTGLAIYVGTHNALIGLVDKRLSGIDQAIVRDVRSRSQLLRRIDEITNDRDTGDIGIELTDAAGWHIAGNHHFPQRPPPGFSSLTSRAEIKGLTAGRVYVREIGGGLTLTTFAESEPIDDYNITRLRIYLAGFGAIIVLVVGALFVFVRAVGQRIAAQNATAEAIIDGDMHRRVPVSGSRNEFDEQARIFNRMLDRIGELMGGLANISSDIAHDLRTPLARLRNQLVAIERRVEDEAIIGEIEKAIAQNDHILAMFSAVLRIVEVEGGDRRAAFKPVDLGTLARRTGNMLVPVVEETGHELTVSRCHDVRIVGDEQLLTQAIINLIENAQRHTPSGSSIELAVEPVGDHAVLTVVDNGPGIPTSQHQRALRRFGRIDKSRARPGHGLGLPLIDAIARLHRGTLELGDAAPGLRVTLVVPRTP